MRKLIKIATRRAVLQIGGFLGVLAVLPDYWFILLLRQEIYKTDYGFVVLCVEWWLLSIFYDSYSLKEFDR